MITDFLSTEMISALAWTLIHSLWQFTLVALLLTVVLGAMRKAKSATRYLVSLSGLGVMMVMVLVTFVIYYYNKGDETAVTIAPLALELHQLRMEPSSILTLMLLAEKYQQLIVNVWLVGTALLFLRFTGAYVYLRSVIKSATIEELQFSKRFKKLKKSFNIQREVLIKSSAKVMSPMVVGFVRPVILFPVGMINFLSTDEVAAILSHELAHIKRHDYLINIFQSLVEVIFYYHPGTWYIMKMINNERENCCDDLAIAHTSGALDYAKTLVKLQELNYATLSPAMGMAGQRGFSYRIKRILEVPVERQGLKVKLTGLIVLMSGLLALQGNSDASFQEDPMEDLDVYIIDDCPKNIADITAYLDTIPERNNFHITKKKDNQSVELHMEEGRVKELKIDGKIILESEYEDLQTLIHSLKPDINRDMITVFPHCGDDFGNIYFLNKQRELYNMDSVLEDFDKRLEQMENDGQGSGFDVHNFHPEVMDSLLLEFKAKDKTEIFASKKIRIDSIMDLVPVGWWNSGDASSAMKDMWNTYSQEDEMSQALPTQIHCERPSLADVLASNLLADAVIGDLTISSVQLTGNYLKVNGQQLSADVWRRYKSIYEEVTEIPLTEQTSIVMEIDPSKIILKKAPVY